LTESGVFDPNHKCPLGIISGKFPSHTIEGEKEVAKYFVPAVAIRDFRLSSPWVGRPAGETLFFGRVAAAVLENSDRSLLFVSS